MAKSKVITRLHCQFLPEAECDRCDWRPGTDDVAREAARAHTLETGHDTRVTFETTTRYGRVDA